MFSVERVIKVEFLGKMENRHELDEAFENTYGTKMDIDM